MFPVREPKFRVKVITGRDTHSAPGLPSVSRWPFSFIVSLFQTVPKCVLTDHQHVIWRLVFPLNLSFTTLSIYDLCLFNLENNLFEASVSLLTVLKSPSCPCDYKEIIICSKSPMDPPPRDSHWTTSLSLDSEPFELDRR